MSVQHGPCVALNNVSDTKPLSRSCASDDMEEQEHVNRNRKWTFSFWALLKFMCLFYHRTVVPRERLCFNCWVERFRKRSRAGAVEKMERYDAEMDPLLVEYEYEDQGTENYEGDETQPLIRAEEDFCPVCESLWWNRDGMTEKYTEQEIGIGNWNHRGSGILSLTVLVGALTLIIYDVVCFLKKLWGTPDLILRLMIKMTLYIILLLYPMLSLCSKLRSIFTIAIPSFRWASALNARYLVKRAQILDIGRKGLPGKLLLAICTVSPFLTALYRFLIFTVISQCGFTLATMVTSLVGIIFNQAFGLYLYLFYFLRVSFQRQFNLLILFIKDNDGDEARCRGAFFSAAVDFNCFKQLVNLSIFIMFPAMVFAISGNITYEYMLANATCIADDPVNLNISHHVLRLAWAEILLSLGTYLIAIGGIQVDYVFNNFVLNLLQLRSTKNRVFWVSLFREISYVTKDSYFFLVTIIFSFISLFMAFNFSNQDITDLAACENTFNESLCV